MLGFGPLGSLPLGGSPSATVDEPEVPPLVPRKASSGKTKALKWKAIDLTPEPDDDEAIMAVIEKFLEVV